MYKVIGNCDYSKLGENIRAVKDRMIRDALIIGTNSEKACDKIIREGTRVTLDQVITILQTEDSTTRTLSVFSSATKSINYLKYNHKKGSKGGKRPGQKKTPSSTTGTPSMSHNNMPKLCYRCKREYAQGHEKECRALKAKCNHWGLIGHFEKCCRKAGNFPKKPQSTVRRQHIAAPESQEGLDFYDEGGNPKVKKQMHMLSTTKKTSTPRHINPQKDLLIEFGISKHVHTINDKVILKVDTGADVNALNRKTFYRLFPEVQLQASSVILKNFDSTYIQPLGTFKCFLRWKGKRYRINMEVMDSDDTPNVLSREQTFMMGILKQCFVVEKASKTNLSSAGNESMAKPVTPRKMDTKMETRNSNITGPLTKDMVTTQFADVFTGLGKFPGPPYELKLKPDAVPAKHRSWKVPVHLQSAFHEEVKCLVAQDVLEPVTEHTEWVNSFVIVEKDVIIDTSNPHSPSHQTKKKFRLCIDPKDLNDALEWEPYYSRTVDELIAKFADATVFTIINMDKGYWQVELHPNSRKYTCMALNIGCFQWKRLPMGTVVASDVFQRKLDSVYIGLPGVTGITDDMIIYGKNEEEHDRNLIRFLKTTRKNGLRLNKDKLQFKRIQCHSLGMSGQKESHQIQRK